MDEYFGENLSKYPSFEKRIEGIAIQNEDDTVLVLVNPNGHGMQVQFEAINTLFYAELRANSVSTIIIK